MSGLFPAEYCDAGAVSGLRLRRGTDRPQHWWNNSILDVAQVPQVPQVPDHCLWLLCAYRPTDMQRVAELVQDPRPVEEKQQLVLQVRSASAVPYLPTAVTKSPALLYATCSAASCTM